MVRKPRNGSVKPHDLLPRIRSIARFYDEARSRALASLKVRPDRYAFMSLIHPDKATPFKRLNEDLQLPRYQVTRTARWLQSRKLITIGKVHEDGRQREVRMTSRGREILNEVEDVIENAMTELLPGGPQSKLARRGRAARLADELFDELRQQRFFEDE